MMQHNFMTVMIVSLINISIKMLFLPTYRSTDFEVHRNWLAITYSLPINQWYFDHTSIWTLDYPPFFAYFQYILASCAVYFDRGMVQIQAENYDNESTVMFMRMAVIVVDCLLLFSTWLYLTTTKLDSVSRLKIFSLVVFNGGLLLVDHIHFQFNGMLLGLIVLCVYFAASKRHLSMTVAFSILVLMKHLFVSLAPVVGVFLIRNHCFVDNHNGHGKQERSFSVFRFVQLVFIALVALVCAFGPFVAQSNGADQLVQIVSRLFPFGRGLVHAYWAPNVWALYCAMDKFGSFVAIKVLDLDLSAQLTAGSNSASGIVGDFSFALLPPVSAAQCMTLLLVALLPALWTLWCRSGDATTLVRCLVSASLSSFMVGYHVHEKAILVPMILQTLVSLESEADTVLFLLMCSSGVAGLMPLFGGVPELPIKGFLLVSFVVCSYQMLVTESQTLSRWSRRLLTASWILLGCLFLLAEVVHPLWMKDMLPFLPLMTTSVVCAALLLIAWGISFWTMIKS